MDAKTARTHNIRLWVAEAGGPAEFANRYGGARWVQAQVSQWISVSNPKGIGHALARDLERACRKPTGSMDRWEGALEIASQSLGIDPEKLRTAIKFLEDLYEAQGSAFAPIEHIERLTAVYDYLTATLKPNLVELAIKFGREFDDHAGRQGKTGSAGKDDQHPSRATAAKAKAATRKAR